jgi:hypothetical protein
LKEVKRRRKEGMIEEPGVEPTPTARDRFKLRSCGNQEKERIYL